MTKAFVHTVLCVWGFTGTNMYFTDDGRAPTLRMGHRSYPGGEPLTVFTALRWPG